MNLASTIAIYGGGTSEGAVRGWETRRGAAPWNPETQTKPYWLDDNGHYLPERTQLHDGLVRKYENKPTQQNPKLTMVLGGSASGKSTYTDGEAAKLRSPAIINTDQFRADLPEFERVAGTPQADNLLDETRDVRNQTMTSALAHNNDIVWEEIGHPGQTAPQLDAMEKNGYKTGVVYVHRPVEDSVKLSNNRAATSSEAFRKIKPDESVVRKNHSEARLALPEVMKPGREVTIMDGTNHWDRSKPYDVIYHRSADGVVDVRNHEALQRMQENEEPKIPGNIF